MAPLKLPGFSTSGSRRSARSQLSQNAVCRILTNRLYCGQIVNGKQEVSDFLTGDRIAKDPQEWDRNRPTGAGHCHPAKSTPRHSSSFSAARILQDPENLAQQRSPVFNASQMPSVRWSSPHGAYLPKTPMSGGCSGHNTKEPVAVPTAPLWTSPPLL